VLPATRYGAHWFASFRFDLGLFSPYPCGLSLAADLYLLRGEGVPPASLPSSSELCEPRPAPFASDQSCDRPACAQNASHGVCALVATSTGGIHVCERHPASRFVPFSAFCTPSTVFATTGLAGLFHPAATSRVRALQGFILPAEPRPVSRTLAFLPLDFRGLCSCPHADSECPRLQGLALRESAVTFESGEASDVPRPSWAFVLLRVLDRSPWVALSRLPPSSIFVVACRFDGILDVFPGFRR